MTMTFWAVGVGVLAIVLWFLFVSTVSSASAREATQRMSTRVRHREKLASLEERKEAGELSPEQYSQGRAELDRELLYELLAEQPLAMRAPLLGGRPLALGLAFAIALAGTGYFLGQQSNGGNSPQVQTAPGASTRTASLLAGAMASAALPGSVPNPMTSPPKGQVKAMSMEEAAQHLAKRLAEKPDDADGWLLLGNSYKFLGKQADAEAAFKRAAALGKTIPASPAGGQTAAMMQPPVAAGPGGNSTRSAASAPETAAPAPGASDAEVAALAAKLAKQPEDGPGWAQLAMLYQQQRRFADASAAYHKALKIDGKNADWLAGTADAVASTNNSLEGEPAALIERALAIDPSHVKALWLAASAARQRGKHADALALWQRLQKVLPPDSPDSKIIAANIEEERADSGTAPKPDAGGTATSGVKSPPHILGRVVLDNALKGELEGGETLFVFARALKGAPMPLAVLRKKAADLPLDFDLDDSLALMPAVNLSSASEVVVGARISKSGNAIAQKGDLEGLSEPVQVGSGVKVDLVINHRRD